MKYGNKKITVDGITFDSKKEANRYCELKTLERSGAIINLEMQKTFELIPAQFENPNATSKKDRGKCLERACKYVADFCYFDNEHGVKVCEDTKGFRTKDYVIKRKLMLYRYGIQIKEI